MKDHNTTHVQMQTARVVNYLIAFAAPLAAFLAFSIQPMLGKYLLPIYGGTVGSWLGAMLYFQTALLLGYAWASWLIHRPLSIQVYATLIIGVIAIVLFRLPPLENSTSPSLVSIFWLLASTTLPAMILLFSVSTLTHGWIRNNNEQAVPYYIYAFSNAGSLAALVLYPSMIEPEMKISDQANDWFLLLIVLVITLSLIGITRLRASSYLADKHAIFSNDETISWKKIGSWLGLSALTCAGMLGATHHVAVEIGSNPLSWVGPFGVYLLSYAVVFSGQWRPWMTRVCVGWLGVSLAGYMITKGFSAATVNGVRFGWLISLTAASSFVGNAMLYSIRPKFRFEKYYLVIAAGGVLGGLASSIIIPNTFSRPLEFILTSVGLLLIGMVRTVSRRTIGAAVTTSVVVVAPILGVGLNQDATAVGEGVSLKHFRDIYGYTLLTSTDNSVVLSSETTTHGSQLTADSASRRRPTLYYSESTAVGRVIERFKAERQQLNVGVVGLGAGTLAAYATVGDHYDFWDIDPKAIRVAQEYFSYTADARDVAINIFQQDGRLGIGASSLDYDLIIIDAFSGDGVPAHLLTQEALRIYFEKLARRNGILLVHATSRYSNLFPTVAATARSLNLRSLSVHAEIRESLAQRDWDPTETDYIVVLPKDKLDDVSQWFPEQEDSGRVMYRKISDEIAALSSRKIWTDERNAAIEVLELSKFLRN